MDDLRLVIKEEAANSHTDSSPLDMNIPSSSNSGSSSGSLEDTLRNSIDLATFDEINKMISYVSEMSEIAKLYFLMKLPGSAISQNNANATYNPFGLSNQSEMNHASVWIHSHLETDPTVCLRKDEVYQEYQSYCERHGIKSLNTADFGKAMKRCFPNVKPRRLGQRGQSKYCYGGLKKKINVEAPQLTDLSAALGRSGGENLNNLLAVDEAHAGVLLSYLNNALGQNFPSLEEAAKAISSPGDTKDEPSSHGTMRSMLSTAKPALQGSPSVSARLAPPTPENPNPSALTPLARPEARRSLAVGSLQRTASSPSHRLDAIAAATPNFSTPPGRSSQPGLSGPRHHALVHEPARSPLASSPFRPEVSASTLTSVPTVTSGAHMQLFGQQYPQYVTSPVAPYFRPAVSSHQVPPQPQPALQQPPTPLHMPALLTGASPLVPAPLRHTQPHSFPLHSLGSPVPHIGTPQPPQQQSPLGLLPRPQSNVKCDSAQVATPPQAHMTAQGGTPILRSSFNVPPMPAAPAGVGSSPFNSGTLMRSAAPPPPPSSDADAGSCKRAMKRHPGVAPNDCKFARIGAGGRIDLDVAAMEKDATYEPDWCAAALSPLGPHDSEAANGGPAAFAFQSGGASGSSDFEDFLCDTPGCPTTQNADDGRTGANVRLYGGGDRLEVGSSPCPSPTQHAVPFSATFSGPGFVKMEPPSTPKSAERAGRPIASLSQRLENQPALQEGEEEERPTPGIAAVSRLRGDLSTPVPMRTPTPTQAPVPLMPQ